MPGRKFTYPRLGPGRGLAPGRGGARRPGRGGGLDRAPEFGVKVGGGGSEREAEAEAEARGRCPASAPGARGGRRLPASSPALGRASSGRQGPQTGR